MLSLPDRAKPNGKAVVKTTAPLFPGCCIGILLPDYSNICIDCGAMKKLVSEMRVVVQQALVVLQALVGSEQFHTSSILRELHILQEDFGTQ